MNIHGLLAGVSAATGAVTGKVSENFVPMLKSGMNRLVEIEERELGIGEAITGQIDRLKQHGIELQEFGQMARIDREGELRQREVAKIMSSGDDATITLLAHDARTAWVAELNLNQALSKTGDPLAAYNAKSYQTSLTQLEDQVINKFIPRDAQGLADLTDPVPAIAMEFLFVREAMAADKGIELRASQFDQNISIVLSGSPAQATIVELEVEKPVSGITFEYRGFGDLVNKLQEERDPITTEVKGVSL